MKAIAIATAIAIGTTRLHAQCSDGSPPPCRPSAPRPTAAASNTIAVLYFDNLSRDTADTYLADGLTEELIGRLTQVERLRVKSRTAVRSLRGKPDQSPATIGRNLAVAQLLTGSVLRSRDRLRVNVELTAVATGNSSWARSYDRPASDLIAVEAEIAESIAVNVAGRIAPEERKRIEERPTTNARAYDHLLRARYAASRLTTSGFLSAVTEGQRAVGLDPKMVVAMVAVSQAYNHLGGQFFSPEVGLARDSLQRLARIWLDRAAKLDSNAVDVLITRANLTIARGDLSDVTARAASTFDLDNSVRLLTQAIARAPTNAGAHQSLGIALRMQGREEEAIAEFSRSVDLEPDRAIALQNLGQTLGMMRRYDEAARWLDSAVALRPDAAFMYVTSGFVALQRSDTARARQMAHASEAHGNSRSAEQLFALIDARRGDTVAARLHVARSDSALAQTDCMMSHECLELAFTWALVGDREKALKAFERVQPRDSWLVYWSQHPEFDSIRSDPRFQRVVAESRAHRAVSR